MFDDDNVTIEKDGCSETRHWKSLLFKDETENIWRIGDIYLSDNEKAEIQFNVFDHYNWKGNVLYKYNGLRIGNECNECLKSKEYHLNKLQEEVNEFLDEINKDSFDRDHAIEEAWDVWTVMSNLLQMHGVNVKEFMDGFNINMNKKVKRGFLFETIN